MGEETKQDAAGAAQPEPTVKTEAPGAEAPPPTEKSQDVPAKTAGTPKNAARYFGDTYREQ